MGLFVELKSVFALQECGRNESHHAWRNAELTCGRKMFEVPFFLQRFFDIHVDIYIPSPSVFISLSFRRQWDVVVIGGM